MRDDPDSGLPILPVGAATTTGERLVLHSETDGTRFAAFLARPPQPSEAAVVVLPEMHGLTSAYEQLAAELARHGYVALAIDYFGRTAGTGPRDADFPFIQHMLQASRATLTGDVGTGIAHLRATGCTSLFTLGFGVGARLSFLAPITDHDLAGAIGFYGPPGITGPFREPGPTQLADEITAPVLALMGGADEGIPPDDVTAFDTALATAGIEHEVIVYPDAPHAFFHLGESVHAGASADAWNRVLAFLHRHSNRRAQEEDR